VTAADPTPDPLPWRRRLARWPDLWRQRWGLRANVLEDAGLDWRSAESQAFDEMSLARDEEE
jgi:hypothetical protein